MTPHRPVPAPSAPGCDPRQERPRDRKSTRLNSSHPSISYAVFCLKKKKSLTTVSENALPAATPGHGVIAHLSTDSRGVRFLSLCVGHHSSHALDATLPLIVHRHFT